MACDCKCTFRPHICGAPADVAPDNDGALNIDFTPQVVDYTGNPNAADAVLAFDPATNLLGATKYARDEADGLIKWVAVCGTWVPLAGSGAAPTGQETITYDLGAWTFPVNYAASATSFSPLTLGGTTFGQFIYNGVNALELCPAGTQQLNVDVAQRADNEGPASGLGVPTSMNTIPWFPENAAEGATGELTSDPLPDGLERDVARLHFAWPAPVAYLFTNTTQSYRFRYEAPGGGNVTVGAWDSGSNTWFPITMPEKPAAAVVEEYGDHIRMRGNEGSPVGNYRIQIDAATASARENVELVFWALNNSGNPETMNTFRAEFEARPYSACYEWTDLADVATFLSTTNSHGHQWTVVGSTVTTTGVTGTGASYGALAGESTTVANPTVV